MSNWSSNPESCSVIRLQGGRESETAGLYAPFPCGLHRSLVDTAEVLQRTEPNKTQHYLQNLLPSGSVLTVVLMWRPLLLSSDNLSHSATLNTAFSLLRPFVFYKLHISSIYDNDSM